MDRHSEIYSNRQTVRKIEWQKNNQYTDGQTDRYIYTNIQVAKQTNSHTDNQIGRQINICHEDMQTNKQVVKEIDDGQTDRYIDRQTDEHIRIKSEREREKQAVTQADKHIVIHSDSQTEGQTDR